MADIPMSCMRPTRVGRGMCPVVDQVGCMKEAIRWDASNTYILLLRSVLEARGLPQVVTRTQTGVPHMPCRDMQICSRSKSAMFGLYWDQRHNTHAC